MRYLTKVFTIILVLLFTLGPRYTIMVDTTNAAEFSNSNSENIGGQNDNTIDMRSIMDYKDLTRLTEGEGDYTSGKFGMVISNPGDFNGDGLDDIAVGGPHASPSSKSDAGCVYIFFGAEDMAKKLLDADSADVKISGTVSFELFGSSICVPGDIDGDNKDDILIGAPGANSNSGKVYGFYSTTLNSAPSLQSDGADLFIQNINSGEKFGTSLISIGDINGDSEQDIMLGAPGSDRAYICYGPSFGVSDRTILIGPQGSNFGKSIAGGTDINKDGIQDFAVGAPVGIPSSNNRGQVFIYLGYKHFSDNKMISSSNNTLEGFSDGDLFGESVISNLDIDDDGYFDLIVGAPGGDGVYIYYGKSIFEKYLYPYLWNMPGDNVQPVDFSSGVYNDVGSNLDVNTYGLGSGDDGWDWGPNVFGTSSGADMDHIYGAREEPSPPYADAEGMTVGNTSRLEVIVGRTNTGAGPTLGWFTTGQDSGAWGIEFSISAEMYDFIEKGAEIFLEVDWEAYDALGYFGVGGGTEETCYVKMRFSSNSKSTYMGTNLGGDSNAELFFWESAGGMNTPFPPARKHFSEDISGLVEGAGSYYLEMGARLEKFNQFSTKDGNEGIIAFFDNVSVFIETKPITYSVKISGVSQSRFGSCLGFVDDINGDGYNELAIGAPYSNLGGQNSGSVFIFYGGTGLQKQMNSNEARRIVSGTVTDEQYGAFVIFAGNDNGDEYNEIAIGAPGYSTGKGKIYLITPAQAPEIEIIRPEGGGSLEGKIEIVVNASDYESLMDKFGVEFYYGINSPGPADWKFISNVIQPSSRASSATRNGEVNQYRYMWDTTDVADGLYRLKAVVIDNTYLEAEDITELFEIDNPDKPVISIISPIGSDEPYSGTIKIKSNCTDADDDLNITSFYYSQDGTAWSYIGKDYDAVNNIYEFDWDTEDLPDGDYFLKVVANDTRGLQTENISDKFKIYNPGPPVLDFLSPMVNDTLIGYSELKVSVKDKDNNISPSGVTFYYSRDRVNWTAINTVTSDNADRSWSTFWNTVKVTDGYYWLKAFAKDTTDLSGETLVGPVLIDNPSPPSITLEPVVSPASGKLRLKAVCFDDDSPLSSEGVSFYVSTDWENWELLGSSRVPAGGITGSGLSTFVIDWDTVNDKLPDSTDYSIKVTVSDITGLANETTFGPFEVNNPDPPTVSMDYPKEGSKIKGLVNVGAYAEDPDGDIDDRGVSFYFSKDGKNWYLIDNSETPSGTSDLYQVHWDTTGLPDGKYQLKAEVVDSKALMAISVIKVKIENEGDSNFMNVSSTFKTGAIIFLVIIIILLAILMTLFLKRRRIKEEEKKIDERKELAKQIRQEIMAEQLRMYPAIAEGPKQVPVLPPFSHAASPYAAAAEAAGERPMLPAYQGSATVVSNSPQTEEDRGPYTAAANSGRAFSTGQETYQPKVGLTPDEIAALKVDGTLKHIQHTKPVEEPKQMTQIQVDQILQDGQSQPVQKQAPATKKAGDDSNDGGGK